MIISGRTQWERSAAKDEEISDHRPPLSSAVAKEIEYFDCVKLFRQAVKSTKSAQKY